MEDKFNKKKESIDEILSDLNGLLNKMPSILDGIKMPEMQPPNYSKPARAPEPQTPRPEAAKEISAGPVIPEPTPAAAPAEPFDAEKTVVLESFAGLPEGSQVPGEISYSQEPEHAPEASPAEFPEAGLPVMPEPVPDQMTFNPGEEAASPEEQPQAGLNPEETGPEMKAEASAYETSRDFGVPDIDALMQMSDVEKPAPEQPPQPLPEAGVLPESVRALEADSRPAFDAGSPEAFEAASTQAGEEPQLAAATSEDEAAEAGEPEAEAVEVPQEEAAPAMMYPGDFIIEPEAKPETSFEAYTIEPSPPEPAPAPEGGELSPEPQGLQFERFAEPAAEPKLEVGQGIQFGSIPEPASGSGIELTPGIELGVGSPVQTPNPDETLSGIQSSWTPSGEETLVVTPRAESSGGEEKTVIFQASPETTTMAQAKDLPSLSARQAPEGIPPERLRSLVFLYSPGDEALCATVLAELDAICLKSATKPMFIKRAYVKDCGVDFNANFIHQSVVDSCAAGLVCVGAVPQEKIYELENAFASSGGFFRYYDPSTFTHSSALDLVADLILR